jgi:hypothetical protein
MPRNAPPTVYPLGVRCPVPYCGAEPHRKCCDKRGVCRADEHRARKTLARNRQSA